VLDSQNKMKLSEIVKEYKDGKITWYEYLAKKYLVDGDTTIFKSVLSKLAVDVQDIAMQRIHRKITTKEFLTEEALLGKQVEKFLFDNKIANDMPKDVERTSYFYQQAKMFDTYNHTTDADCYAMDYEGSLITLSWLDYYFKQYIPAFVGKPRFDIYSDELKGQKDASASNDKPTISISAADMLKYTKDLP